MPETRRAPGSAAAAAVARAMEALVAFCAAERLPSDVTWRLRVAVDEVVANIATHARTGRAAPAIELTFRRDAGGVEVTVMDDGPPFDPLSQPEPDLTLPLDARQPGGLGITLVKSLVDRARYERTTRNELRMWTRVDSAPDSGEAASDDDRTQHS